MIEEGNNPVITKVQTLNGTNETAFIDKNRNIFEDTSNIVLVTFFGVDRKIAEINASAGSETGYGYGACVTVRCEETGSEKVLVSY